MRLKPTTRSRFGPAGARAACSASRMDAIDLCEDEVEQPSPHENDAVWILDDEDENEVAQAALPAAQASVPSAAKQNIAAAGPGSTEVYVLDCGCQEHYDSLVSKLSKRAEGVQTAGSTAEAVDSFSCSSCGTLLSAQDVWKLLGPETTSKLYTAVAGSVKQTVLAQQGQADEHSTATQAATVAAVCCELWGELAALQALMLGGEPPAATPAATTSTRRQPQRSKAAQKQPKAAAKPKAKPKAKYSYLNHSGGNSSAWAAGTGFGGSMGTSKAAQEAMSAAAKRQAAVDTAMTTHFQAITAILQDPLPTAPPAAAAADNSAAGPSTSRKRGRSDARLYSGLPWPLCGMVLAGPLAWLLRLLYQNDSLMDVVGRAELYSAGMELMRHVGSSTDLLPLLQLPADDPRDTTPAAPTTAAGPSSSSSSSSTVMSTLRRLEQQAKLYQRSAEQLMGEDEDGAADDEDTTAAVCLALDLSNMVQTLEEGLNLWTHTLGQAGSLNIKPISAAADPQQTAAQPNTTADRPSGGSSGKRRARIAAASPSAPPAAPDPAAAAAAAQAQRYMSAMQPYRFIEADLLGAGHYFARDAADSSRKAAGGEVMRKRLKRITEELGALSTSLPLSWDSSILLAVHADRLDVLRALLLPHPDTPYGGGAFLFDIFLPPDYPNKPPKVQFLTTGEGRWRANPNLYECGKVCLSLLGTWSGPSWEPGVSTLLQVLVSLQSMVLVSDPFFNEPGFERQAGTASGRAQAEQYNAGIRLGTATHAILAQLRKPDPVFGEAVRLHYSHQGERVSALLQQWARETKHNKSELQTIVKQVQQEIRKLPALPAEPQEQQQQQQEVEPEGVSRPQRSGRSGRGRGRQQQPAEVCDADTDVVDLT